MVLDTGAQAFFIHKEYEKYCENGGKKSPVVILSAKKEACMDAGKTG